jgi:peptide/nickel transport system ATP-binding protein
VGESGCGKSTLGLTVLRAYDPTTGEVLLDLGGGRRYDLAQLSNKELKPLRKEIQMIFQDPYSSLSPRMTVREIVSEPLVLNGMKNGPELDEEVGLNAFHMRRYPHAFSGGQRQRIGIARALVLNPRFVVADEAVSALDVSVQAQIIELLLKLKNEFDLTYLFISHNLSVVRYFCTTVGVMYVGKLVELAPAEELFENPLHPYSEALMSAIPIPNPYRRNEMRLLPGEVPDPANPPSGCYFHTRCPFAKPICAAEEPPFRPITGEGRGTHFSACHFAGELPLESPMKKNKGGSPLKKPL